MQCLNLVNLVLFWLAEVSYPGHSNLVYGDTFKNPRDLSFVCG